MLREISHRKILYNLTYMWNLKPKTKLTENRLVVASGSDGEWSEGVRGSGWGK